MSSNITPIYNAIISQLGTLFSSKTRIPNPYSLSDNMAQFLDNGYGLRVGPASPAEPFEFCSLLVGHTFTVVLTKELQKLDTEFAQLDSVVLAFLEDIVSVQNLFYSYSELGIEANIAKVDVGERSALEQVNTDKFSYVTMSQSFTFFAVESIT